MELLVIVASIFRRYHFVLEDPSAQVSSDAAYFTYHGCRCVNSALKLETREGFLRKPVECKIGMKRRHM